jgi:hypothetical protein
VEFQAVVAKTPIITDAFLLVDDQRIEADSLQFDRGRDACMSASDYQNIRFTIFKSDFSAALLKPARFAEIPLVRYGRIIP